jgi:hypothetical protein
VSEDYRVLGYDVVYSSKHYSMTSHEIFAIMGRDAVSIGSTLSTFQENLSVPSSRIRQFLLDPWKCDR